MKNMNLKLHRYVVGLALTIAVLLTGCASAVNPGGESSFSCPGMPQGIVCKTPSAVYKSTNQMPAETENDLPLGQHLGDKSGPPAGMTYVLPKPVAAQGAGTGTGAGIVKTSKAKPVREAAQVMRIWIAEWTDKNDDLHYPGYLFTEIQPRRWSVGKSEASGRNTTVPFRAAAAPAGASGKEQPVAAKPAEGEARQSAAMSMPGLPSPSDINLN
jgi:conjugal transfer pilus assembly protein TraV